MSTEIVPYQQIERMAATVAKSGLFAVKTQEAAVSLIRRFLSHVSVDESGCWLWIGARTKAGYGKLSIGSMRNVPAHRASFQIFKSAAINSCVLHRCDVRRCVNPEHLFAGSKSDNTRDMVAKGRHFSAPRLRTTCPQGHPYSGVNSQGRRICSICQSNANKRHRTRNESHEGARQ
jgi:hypothetical protein